MSCDVSVKNQNKIFKLKQRTAARKTYLLCGQYAVFLKMRGLGHPQQTKQPAVVLRAICGCRVARDGERPRLLLGKTKKRNIPQTLVYQGFGERKIKEIEVVDDFTLRKQAQFFYGKLRLPKFAVNASREVFVCALGTRYNLAVKVRYRLGSRNCYYGIEEMKKDMDKWNEWLRRRIRMYIWKQRKLPRTRVANLKKLGMPDWMAYRNGNTCKEYWTVAGSGILTHTITNEILARRGYYDISEAYKCLHYL